MDVAEDSNHEYERIPCELVYSLRRRGGAMTDWNRAHQGVRTELEELVLECADELLRKQL